MKAICDMRDCGAVATHHVLNRGNNWCLAHCPPTEPDMLAEAPEGFDLLLVDPRTGVPVALRDAPKTTFLLDGKPL